MGIMEVDFLVFEEGKAMAVVVVDWAALERAA